MKLRNILIGILFINAIFLIPSHACTRVLHVEDQAVMVGRTMDWSENMNTQFRIYPRGMEKTGKAAKGLSLEWKSKYGSMVVASYQNISTDGINEKGLAMHLLELSSSNYGERQLKHPGLSASEWGQYLLDNFATVEEALEDMQGGRYQVEEFYLAPAKAIVGLHLALEDNQGNSAIVEFVNGKAVYHREKGNAVLTNSPTYDLHLENLKLYTGFGGDKPLPGTSSSKDRFVRASFYNNTMPIAKTAEEEAFAVFSIMRSASVPFKSSKTDKAFKGGSLWQVVGDLTHRSYYYLSNLGYNIVRFQLDQFDLSEGAKPLFLEIDKHPELHGNIEKYFMPLPM